MLRRSPDVLEAVEALDPEGKGHSARGEEEVDRVLQGLDMDVEIIKQGQDVAC